MPSLSGTFGPDIQLTNHTATAGPKNTQQKLIHTALIPNIGTTSKITTGLFLQAQLLETALPILQYMEANQAIIWYQARWQANRKRLGS